MVTQLHDPSNLTARQLWEGTEGAGHVLIHGDNGGTPTPIAVDGSGNIGIQLPTGISTEAKQDTQITHLLSIIGNQLPDGHNVTVDNASIAVTGPLTDAELRATPVPVADGGGSLTIDNANLDTPLSTLETTLNNIESGQLPDGHNVTIDNASLDVNLQDGAGTDITSTLDSGKQGLDVNISSADVSLGGGTEYTEGDVDATITGTAMMMEDAGNTMRPAQGSITDGLLVNLGANNDVTVAGVATAAGQLPDGHNVTVDNASLVVVGDVAHDGVDSGAPLKWGGKAFDLEPTVSGTRPGQPDVAANDRTNGQLSLYGAYTEAPVTFYELLTGIDGEYNDVTTTRTSAEIDAWPYRFMDTGMDIVSSGTPTTIQIIVEGTVDGTNWIPMRQGPLGQWIYDDTFLSSEQGVSYETRFRRNKLRVRVVCTGTTATNTFTVDNAYMALGN